MATLDLVETALGYALRLLAQKAYTEKALREKLLLRFSEPEVEEALARLKEYGYLDDLAFARMFVEGRKGKYGPLKLRALLRARGVPEEVVEAVLPSATVEEALALLRRYPKKDKDRAVRFLRGRGFPLEMALEAYRRLAEEEKPG